MMVGNTSWLFFMLVLAVLVDALYALPLMNGKENGKYRLSFLKYAINSDFKEVLVSLGQLSTSFI